MGYQPPFQILLNEHKLFWNKMFSKCSQLCLQEVKTFFSTHLRLQSCNLAKWIQTPTGTLFIVWICFNAYGKSPNTSAMACLIFHSILYYQIEKHNAIIKTKDSLNTMYIYMDNPGWNVKWIQLISKNSKVMVDSHGGP